ncbi:uncharacterized protein LOC133838522 [Drosophila sulfurigaster albostrigata]|uniref:uncharacterized protein LOC133838522 n=1 Tax=Drosophila sulfurigaster albostrigata TaxID=89887 RepID=UPI002D21A415|nr:uncharacterized protein LOC133838522 [Drosophila sulfurigaster albostrigata]
MTPNIDNFNADELEAPAWLNDQFFRDVLVKHLNDANVKVIDFKTSPATAKGDHYASVMFRGLVEYSTKEGKFSKSLIIKTMPEEEGHKKEFLGDSHIFPTEITMYTKVLPKFEEILAEAGDKTTFCAKCIYHTEEPRQVMVFEDLVPQKYDVVRKRPATIDEIKSAVGKLAKWQAVSYKLLQEKSDLFDTLQYDLTTMPNILEQEVITKGFPTFLETLQSVDSLRQYVKYFEPLKDKLIQRWVEALREYRVNRKDDTYYVLCHGDFHIKNMMFKGTDCMLLDFQMSYVGALTNDVLYSIYMLLGPEERREKRDEFIYYFFTTFTNTLAKIGYQGKKPSLVEFRRQLHEKKYIDIFLMSSFLPTFNHMRKGNDPADFLEDAEKRRALFAEKDFQEELEYLIPRMVHVGYFE